ncbi:hypothetical protein SEA_HANKLY_28 [Arthrobacter phage Hankly]|nr:hypothetical protein SEA_HANKLY_28 [Arthrobacter phage Hankly]
MKGTEMTPEQRIAEIQYIVDFCTKEQNEISAKINAGDLSNTNSTTGMPLTEQLIKWTVTKTEMEMKIHEIRKTIIKKTEKNIIKRLFKK